MYEQTKHGGWHECLSRTETCLLEPSSAGRHKGQLYRCTVLEHEGKLVYSLDDNSIHGSVSAAASAVMGGASVNGWRFWTLQVELQENAGKTAEPASTKPALPKLLRTIKKLPNQKGVAEGSTKWWCSACMKSFVTGSTLMPEQCPEGHPCEEADEFEVVQEAAQAE
ncbi:MAG: hypothetical protein IT300_04475 [Dehalococcoidia bacterium]|nr:hypothetical protein [Dehalococcoidia bacterium]